MYVDAYAVVVSFEESSVAILSELVFSTFSLDWYPASSENRSSVSLSMHLS